MMKKNRKLKIGIFFIFAIIIVIFNLILLNIYMQPDIMFSPGLGPAVQENVVSFTLIIFGSIAVSLIVLFVLFYFFVIKN